MDERELRLAYQKAGLPYGRQWIVGRRFVFKYCRAKQWREIHGVITIFEMSPRRTAFMLYGAENVNAPERFVLLYHISTNSWEAFVGAPTWWNKSRKKFIAGSFALLPEENIAA